MDYTKRRDKLAALENVDVIALVPGANLEYFTGLDFHLSERPTVALFKGDDLSLIVPELEVPRINVRPDLEARLFTWSDTDGYEGAFHEAIDSLGLRGGTLGVDDMTMRVFEWLTFQYDDPTMQLRKLGKTLQNIRAIKTRDEIEAMRQAAKLSEQALDHLLAWIKPGVTEREIADQLDEELKKVGCTELSFASLIQTGENSALPHGNVTDRVLKEGEFLLIDYGGRFDGYPADITRTFCVGTPSDEMKKIYDAVLRANRAAVAVVKPGIPCSEVDKAARDVINEAGYGDYFIHRTGHGLGLEVHELPQIADGVEDTLQPGMVFTIEPGIYIPGLGGVRIEDNVAVTETGVDVLTNYRRELKV